MRRAFSDSIEEVGMMNTIDDWSSCFSGYWHWTGRGRRRRFLAVLPLAFFFGFGSLWRGSNVCRRGIPISSRETCIKWRVCDRGVPQGAVRRWHTLGGIKMRITEKGNRESPSYFGRLIRFCGVKERRWWLRTHTVGAVLERRAWRRD